MHLMYGSDNINYRIGIYIRLSREDGDDLESESVSNQRSLLMDFLLSNNLTLVDEYVDDGYSGGNFERPSFKRLLKDIRLKKIDCVITKDLSRLGRDYIDTGYYVERFFPENNIRYIAINDDIDTFFETGGSEMMPFRLGINDMYAKDISKKVRSNLLAMKKEGKFCGSVPPYGYKRDSFDKYKLVPDPNTAPIVKKIFELYISGYSTSDIALKLTNKKIPTPIMLKNKESVNNRLEHPEIWKRSTVNNILKNAMYLGDMIQHKVQNINYKTKKRKDVPQDEWCIVRGTHEPLVDKVTFDMAQALRGQHNTYSSDRRNVEYVLSNIVYCKDCNAKMQISYDRKRDRITMNCGNYKKFHKYGICFSHYTNYKILENTVFNSIRSLIGNVSIDNELKRRLKKVFHDPQDEMIMKIKEVKDNIKKLKDKQKKLYDDRFNNIISVDNYMELSRDCEEEKKNNIELYREYQSKFMSLQVENKNTFDDIISSYLKLETPTKELMRKIVDKIYIRGDKSIEIIYKIRN